MRGAIYCLIISFSFTVVVPIALGVYAIGTDPTLRHLVSLLKNWQTLLVGFWTIGAALVAGSLLWHQIKTAERLEADKRDARLKALRAGLPMILGSLSAYLATCIRYLESSYRSRFDSPQNVRLLEPKPLPLDDSIASYLANVLEVASGDISVALTILLQELQIQNARLCRSMDIVEHRRTLSNSEIVQRIGDALIVHARCDTMFDYARGRTTAPPTILLYDHVVPSTYHVLKDPESIEGLSDSLVTRFSGIVGNLASSPM